MSRQEGEIIETVVVSEKGQVSIPSDIRKKMGVDKGDRLIFVYKDGKMLVMPARRLWKENMEEEFDYLLKLSEGSARDLWDNETRAHLEQFMNSATSFSSPFRSVLTQEDLNNVLESSYQIVHTT